MMIDENEKPKLKITVQACSKYDARNKQIIRLSDTESSKNYSQKNKKHTYKQIQKQTCSGQTHTEKLIKSEK